MYFRSLYEFMEFLAENKNGKSWHTVLGWLSAQGFSLLARPSRGIGADCWHYVRAARCHRARFVRTATLRRPANTKVFP
jgi:hypothetical protein